MHFQLVAQGHPSLNTRILFGIALPQRGRKDVGRGFAQQRGDAFKAAATGQRQVRQQIARLGIFDKKDHIGNGIQQRRDQRQRIEQRWHIFRRWRASPSQIWLSSSTARSVSSTGACSEAAAVTQNIRLPHGG
jgi:hypothetical protein